QPADESELAQAPGDPVGTAARAPPAILGEALGVAGVVEVAELDELCHHLVGDRRLDALAEQHAADLIDRPVAAVQRPPRERAGALDGIGLRAAPVGEAGWVGGLHAVPATQPRPPPAAPRARHPPGARRPRR